MVALEESVEPLARLPAPASLFGPQAKGAAWWALSALGLELNIVGLISMLLANCAMLKFMPFKVFKVINCTSKA